MRVLPVRGQVGVEGPGQVVPLSGRFGTGEEQLLVAAADPAPGLHALDPWCRLVGGELAVEPQGDGGIPAVHESLRVLPSDAGGVEPVREGGIGDELELLVPQGLPEDQEDLSDALGQGIGVA